MDTIDPAKNQGTRLDSWKAIAAHLKRDERTVRRWERELGLPIRRIAGSRGASVFAFTSEIDAWLTRLPQEPAALQATAPQPSRSRLRTIAVLSIVSIAVAAMWWWLRPATVSAADLHLEVTATGVTAYDTRGAERWRYNFPADSSIAVPGQEQAWAIRPGSPPEALAMTMAATRHTDGKIAGGSLIAFTARGTVARTFSFDDHVTFGDKQFDPPWGLTAMAVEPAPPHRIAVSAHHYVWNPGLVTVLDDRFRRRGTFVHDGWIETVRWIGAKTLMIGGYSNAHEGGMIAILDVDEMEGQGPEPVGSPHFCRTCGNQAPVRMVILPRSEVNRAAAAPFNRPVVQLSNDHLIARTVEVASEQGPAEAIYEFTPSLDLISASFSERYWDMHRALETQGKLDHSADTCPARSGPVSYESWDRVHGWQRVTIQRGRR